MSARSRKIVIALGGVGTCVSIGILVLFGVLVGAAVMGRNAAIRAGYEVATIQNLKTILAVESQYFYTHERTFGTLAQLSADNGLSAKFSGNPAVADGYVFTLTLSRKPDGSSWYQLTADPRRDSAGYTSWLDESTGKMHFYFDSSGDCIRASPDRQAAPPDPCFELTQ